MLKRKMWDVLEKWVSESRNKCLVIEGARQVGKTFIIREFGKHRFESFIELNFIEHPEYVSIFEGALDAESIITAIKLYIPEVHDMEDNTLLFLDEIQDCPNAITALKFLASDSKIKVICSGSALGMDYKRTTSYPAGAVDHIEMVSMDFEEFLWAMGVEQSVVSALRKLYHDEKHDTPVPHAIHEKMNQYLRQYMVLGGMPAVVQAYIDTNDYREADRIQRNLYQDYLNDIARYAEPAEKVKAEKCYRTIPMQLSKENHKFQYSKVEKGGSARKYETSIDWLSGAHMVIVVHNLSELQYPLKAYAIMDNFRLYPNDIGLLICTFGYELKAAILADTMIEEKTTNILLGKTKGGLYEALAADMLYKAGHHDLYFYKNEAATREIEFFVENNHGVIPVEIKAGRTETKSLNAVLQNDSIPYGFKFASQNIGKKDKKITMPLYMLMFLEK